MKQLKSLRSVINYSAMATASSNRGKWNHQKVYGTTENADAMAASDVSTSGIMDVSEDVENDGHEQQDIVNDISSETESDLSSDTDLSDVSSLSDTEEDLCDAPRQDLSNYELEAMCIVSFLLKHRLTAVTAKDAVSLLRVLCPESNIMQSMTYDKIMSFAVKSNYTCFHYCSLCNNVFPINNADDFRCRKVVLRDGRHQECNGLRYKGSALQQMKPDRQPCNFFLIAERLKYFSQVFICTETIGIFDFTKISWLKNPPKRSKCEFPLIRIDFTLCLRTLDRLKINR